MEKNYIRIDYYTIYNTLEKKLYGIHPNGEYDYALIVKNSYLVKIYHKDIHNWDLQDETIKVLYGSEIAV